MRTLFKNLSKCKIFFYKKKISQKIFSYTSKIFKKFFSKKNLTNINQCNLPTNTLLYEALSP